MKRFNRLALANRFLTASIFILLGGNLLPAQTTNADAQLFGTQIERLVLDRNGRALLGAHNDPVATWDNVYRPGNYVLSTPFDNGAIWSTYELGRGLKNTAIVPGYAYTELAVSYRIDRRDRFRYRINVNINNLFDRYYFGGVRAVQA